LVNRLIGQPAADTAHGFVESLDPALGIENHHAIRAVIENARQPLLFPHHFGVQARVMNGERGLIREALARRAGHWGKPFRKTCGTT
jgi:hypothetical protein